MQTAHDDFQATLRRWLDARTFWWVALCLLLLLALWIRWPVPSMAWTHIDEKAFVSHPLGFFSGDLNPHFFNYPTLQLYLAALTYLGYWLSTGEELLDFVAWRTFIDASDILLLARGLTTIMAVGTVAVTASLGRRLYGPFWGLAAATLLALTPLHVRFSHLAATDVPSVLWSSLAVLWAVRSVQRNSTRDLIIAGVFCGLSAATKYPGAIAGTAILAAASTAFPGRRLRVLVPAVAAAALIFAVSTPYVWLDLTKAVGDLGIMAREHLLSDQHSAHASGLRHLLFHNLRYGLGTATCIFLVAGLLWRPQRMTAAEGVVVATLIAFAVFAAAASSAFMRYAVPMAPLAAVMALRVLKMVAIPRPLAAGLFLIMLAEPGHASWRMHTILESHDTRIEARAVIESGLPQGGRVVHFSSGNGRPHLLSPDFVARRAFRSVASYGLAGVADLYDRLARRTDLPPLYIIYPPTFKQLRADDSSGTVAVACLLDHPLCRAEAGPAVDTSAIDWYREIRAGDVSGAIFDPVDWYLVPVAGFDDIRRSGPNIRLSSVRLAVTEPIPVAASYFQLLADVTQGAVQRQQDNPLQALRHYEAALTTPYQLRELLPVSDLTRLYYGAGAA